MDKCTLQQWVRLVASARHLRLVCRAPETSVSGGLLSRRSLQPLAVTRRRGACSLIARGLVVATAVSSGFAWHRWPSQRRRYRHAALRATAALCDQPPPAPRRRGRTGRRRRQPRRGQRRAGSPLRSGAACGSRRKALPAGPGLAPARCGSKLPGARARHLNPTHAALPSAVEGQPPVRQPNAAAEQVPEGLSAGAARRPR